MAKSSIDSSISAGAKQALLEAAASTGPAALSALGTSENGLTDEAADAARRQYGGNAITAAKSSSAAKRLAGAFINPFTIVLLVLAAISFFTDVVMADPGEKNPWSVIIVVVMVLISGVLRFVQEARSGKAAEKLGEMVKTTIATTRGGKTQEIPIDGLVRGDIVRLAAGDMIPADLRILSAKDLFVSQSSLTGESEAVEKKPESQTGSDPLSLSCLAFMGTNVVTGSASAVVVNTGNNTYFGSIAKNLSQKPPPTSFEKGLNSVSWLLIRFMLVMVPVVLVLSGWHTGNWTEAFLFAVSVAVGLTPAMLPTIVAAGLAKGAVALSKKQVIVKDLNSIQNFGGMDVLCTDKTGTLTQDKVTLMYSLNVYGQEDQHVLNMAILNSYYQTGLKNLMDVAVLDYAQEHNETCEYQSYTKVDEIPFDFSRRRMSVVVKGSEGNLLVTKGAIEEMLAVCTTAWEDGRSIPITDEVRRCILDRVDGYNNDGMRVLGIASKPVPAQQGAYGVNAESGMQLIGYLSFLDPPKDSAADAIHSLQEYGVDVKILTGDNAAVTRAICKKVGIAAQTVLTGEDVEDKSDDALEALVERVNVFAKLSPQQKSRVVAALRRKGHTVGYMGDGINDAASMKQADVGISVDTAVDIAKESADIILLDKDLKVLQQGLLEGRKTYANIIKYIKITVSSNFGTMLSVLAASLLLPFLPMLPLQLLILNLIYDIACISIPWDNVDPDYLKTPRGWETKSIARFMLWLGPASSVFDLITFAALFWWLAPLVAGGAWAGLPAAQQGVFASVFETGWFVQSLASQTLILFLLRSPGLPFVKSRPSRQLVLFTLGGLAVGTALPYTPVGRVLGMAALPPAFFFLLAGVVAGYILLTSAVKWAYMKRYNSFL